MFVKRFTSKIAEIIYSVLPWNKRAIRAGVKLGKGSTIVSKCWSSEPYLITIGEHCQITKDVVFQTHGGGQAIRYMYPKFDCFGKISIGNYVYIGERAMLMPGVSVGNHVLIAAGSIVTKSVPDNVVVAGCPAKIICTMDEYIKRNLQYNTNSKGLSHKQKKKLLLSLPDDKFIRKSFMQK